MAVDQQVLASVVERCLDAPRGLGTGTLICIDGPAGSGKTTLAAQLGPLLSAQVIHMDDLYPGWQGINQGAQLLVNHILEPLSAGQPGRYPRYDWMAGKYMERHQVPLADFLVVEGCASATKSVDRYDPLIIWVQAPDDIRLARGLERDGTEVEQQWLTFMEQERAIYEEHETASRAHIKIDGFGALTANIT